MRAAIIALCALALAGCSEAPQRPDDQQPQGFCARHSQGCVITAGTVAVAAVFVSIAAQPRHHRDPANNSGGGGQPCNTDGCIN